MGTAAIIATLIFGSVQCEGSIRKNDADNGSHTLTFSSACAVKLSDCLDRAVVVTEDGVERMVLGCSTDMSNVDFDTNDWEG